MRVWAVDPGTTGSLAVLTENGSFVYDIPCYTTVRKGKRRGKSVDIKRTHYDELEVARLIDTIYKQHGAPRAVYIEQVASRPTDGVVQAFSLGSSYGFWLGLLAAHEWRVEKVTPSTWKRHFKLLKQEKEASRLLALEKFPSIEAMLARKKDHNRAEALLIALYGRFKES